jgi:hypothetical protein
LYKYTFDIPFYIIDKFISSVLFDKIIKEFSILTLVKIIIKYIKCKPLVKIKKCSGDLGSIKLGFEDRRDIVWLDSRLQLNEFPGVIIHECLHGLFPQLMEDDTEKLELFFMRKVKHRQIDRIVNCFWKYSTPSFEVFTKHVNLKRKIFMRRK